MFLLKDRYNPFYLLISHVPESARHENLAVLAYDLSDDFARSCAAECDVALLMPVLCRS
jgi:hypothetical protein